MRTADGDFVHVLSARAGGADERDDIHVRFGDFDIASFFFEIGDDVDRGEAGLAFALGVERAGPHQAMHARLGAQVAVGVFALDQQRDVFDPGLFAPACDRLR